MALWETAVVLVAALAMAAGEVRFVCPRPTSPVSDSSVGSCRTDQGPFKLEYTDVGPGLMTIEFEEPVVRKGGIMSVELIDLDDTRPSCLLLDQIPHNVAHRPPSHPYCRLNDYPLGYCNTTTLITLFIPDITCNKCVLQLTQYIMPIGKPYCKGGISCVEYHSCAHIRITPTRANSNMNLTTANCSDFYDTRVNTNWGIDPPIIYSPKASRDKRFPPESFLFVDNPVLDEIKYDVRLPRDLENMKVRLLRHRTAATPMFQLEEDPITPNRYTGILPQKKNRNFRRAELSDGPVLWLTFINSTGWYGYHITEQLKLEWDSMYMPQSMSYTPSGWINSTWYIGPGSRAGHFVYPRGHCAPPVAQYGAPLVNTSNHASGIISYISSDFLHVTGVFPQTATNWTLSYDTNETLHTELTIENTAMATVEYDRHPENFTVEPHVSETNGNRLTGKASKALQALAFNDVFDKLRIGESRRRPYALAILSLVGTHQYRVDYFLKNIRGRTPRPTDVVLTYPTVNDVTHNLTHGIFDVSNFQFGGWPAHAIFNGTGDEFFIRTGHYGIRSTHSQGGMWTISAKFDIPHYDFCNQVNHVFCDVLPLRKYTPTPSDSRYADPTGVASLVMGGNGRLQIRMFIRRMRNGEKVHATYLYTTRPDTPGLRQNIDAPFEYSAVESKTATISVSVVLGGAMKTAWDKGEVYVAVQLTEGATISTQAALTTTPPTTTTTRPTTKPTGTGSTVSRLSTLSAKTGRTSRGTAPNAPASSTTPSLSSTTLSAPGHNVSIVLLFFSTIISIVYRSM